MIYYKVKSSSDQVRQPTKKFAFLIANELFTEKEIAKKGFNNTFIHTHFVKLKLSSRGSYFFFGARMHIAFWTPKNK